MKYVIAIPDGAADEPADFPERRSPLAAAAKPMMDSLADCGVVAFAQNVPEGLSPGSDVACLSIFGYNPAEIYTGRAPLEAASMGVDLKNDVAFRCNLVTIENGAMKEFTAGHISTPEAAQIIEALNESLASDGVCFHTGVQYRHIMQSPPDSGRVACTPPHDILDRPIEGYLPSGESQDFVRNMMERSRAVLADHPVNRARVAAGKPPATQIWLWGQGTAPRLKPYSERIGLTGGVISAVDLIKGIGTLAGLEIVEVEGATGLPDTNYEGKAEAALDVLTRHDLVFIHVESTDEMGHAGDYKRKTSCVADFDQRMLRIVVEGLRERGEEFRLVLLPDHPTPVKLRTHTNQPVPFLLYDSRDGGAKGSAGYSEDAVRSRSETVIKGHCLLDILTGRMPLNDATM
ncbi:MAG: cofactor-independent phosphoglycerate mutase [bacterium]|nr:cofactor-independent phosphoglycerate mutase [bacterium]